MLAILLEPLRRYHNRKHAVKYRLLHFVIRIGCGQERGRGIDLNQPWLQVLFNENIVAIHLETVAVVVYQILNRLQRDVDNMINVPEAFVGCLLPSGLFEVESQVLNTPFATMLLIVLIRMLLYSNIC